MYYPSSPAVDDLQCFLGSRLVPFGVLGWQILVDVFAVLACVFLAAFRALLTLLPSLASLARELHSAFPELCLYQALDNTVMGKHSFVLVAELLIIELAF